MLVFKSLAGRVRKCKVYGGPETRSISKGTQLINGRARTAGAVWHLFLHP